MVHWDSQKTQYVNDPEDKGEGEVVDDDDEEELQESKAKERTNQVLDACPKEVIQKFINHSWRFVDSYRKGLTGEAAAGVEKKQKGHQAVSKKAMKALKEQLKLHKRSQIRGAWSL